MTTEYLPEKTGSYGLTAFLLGAAVGAVAALLLAPASGAETRKKVKKFSKDLTREAKRRFEQGRARVQEAVEEGAEVLQSEMGSSSRTSYSPQDDKYDH